MTTLCIITGAATISCGFMYIVLRIGCWADGREW